MPHEIKPTKFDKLNLTFTILGPIVVLSAIAVVGWIINAKFKLERDESDKAYVGKEWFVKQTTASDNKMENIANDVSQVKVSVAVIQGQLGSTVRTSAHP